MGTTAAGPNAAIEEAEENTPSILFTATATHYYLETIPFAAQSDGTVVAGQPFQYYEYYEGGRAYIFDKNSGARQTVARPEELKGAHFATEVAIGGDVVAVGSHTSDAVFIYDVHGKQLGLAHCPGRVQTDGEGELSRQRRLAVGGGAKHLIIVGAQDNRLAYVLDATGAEVAKLQASDGSAGFGDAVSADEGIIVVGASGASDGAGAAYIFDEDFALVKKVEQPSLKSNSDVWDFARLGFAVDVDQAADTIVVGAPGADAAYIFDTAGALKEELLPEEVPAGSNGFGFAVAAANGVIAVGAPLEKTVPPGGKGEIMQGSVYLFDAAGKRIGSKLRPAHPKSLDEYGWSVQIGSTPPTMVGGEAVEQPPLASGFVAVGSLYGGSVEIHTFSM